MTRAVSQLPERLLQLIRALGFFQTVHYLAQRLCDKWGIAQNPYTPYSKRARYPLLCRPRSSDPSVFNQIFVLREYAMLDNLRVSLVIDCGANVGYSSAYFLNQFPDCTLIAVESDDGNFQMLAKNLAPYGTRARAIHSAVWSHPASLTFSEQK